MRRSLVGVLGAAVIVASCGGDDDTATSVADSVSSSTVEPVAESVVDSTQEPSDSEAPQSTTPSEDGSGDAILPVPDAEAVVQTTPTSGGGTRPLLSWEPVDGAATYLVIVFAGDAPYWSTITDAAETYVGGARAIPEGVDGPEVSEGYSWAVYAEDENGTPIASSPIRPISP